MKQPLCWITNAFDRSPAELLWVTSDKWGPLEGLAAEPLLRLRQDLRRAARDGERRRRRAACARCRCRRSRPAIMRGRFHPTDGQLYACGMFAWAGNQTAARRVLPRPLHRQAGRPAGRPEGEVGRGGNHVHRRLDPANAADVKNYEVKVWGLKRSQNYGSKHIDERPLAVAKAALLPDGKTVRLDIPDLAPTWAWRSSTG